MNTFETERYLAMKVEYDACPHGIPSYWTKEDREFFVAADRAGTAQQDRPLQDASARYTVRVGEFNTYIDDAERIPVPGCIAVQSTVQECDRDGCVELARRGNAYEALRDNLSALVAWLDREELSTWLPTYTEAEPSNPIEYKAVGEARALLAQLEAQP